MAAAQFESHISKIHWPEAIALAAVLFAVVAVIALAGGPPSGGQFPRLVGYGCEGSTGPLYADEEDDFPPCAYIEAR